MEPGLPAAARALGGLVPPAPGVSRHGGRARRTTPTRCSSETELPEDGLVVYRLRAWPEGEVVRDRVVYGPAFVRAAEAERERARVRERARPWRFLLYPLVGLLPEEEQERLCDRLGLYAVTATLVSGLVEGLLVLLVPVLLARPGPAHGHRGGHDLAGLQPAGAAGLRPGVRGVLPARDRRLGAGRPRLRGAARARRAARAPRPQLRPAHAVGFLGAARPPGRGRRHSPTARSSSAACCRTSRWGGGRRLSAGDDFWSVTPEPPVSRPRPARLRVSPRAARRAAPPGAPPPARPTRPPTPRRCSRGAARVGRAQRGLRVAHQHAPRRSPGARLRPPRRAPRPRVARRLARPGAGSSGALRAELPARAAGRPAGSVPGRASPSGSLIDAARRIARGPPRPLRAEPLPLPAAVGLAPPRAPGLARPPRAEREALAPIGRTSQALESKRFSFCPQRRSTNGSTFGDLHNS